MKSNSQNIYCTNCGAELHGEYCSHCGQKNTFRRASIKDAFGALASGLLSMERGIIGSLVTMVKDPARVIRVFWSGGRYYFLTPGQMILYVILILGVHLTFFGERLLGFQVELSNVPEKYSGLFNVQVLFAVFILPLATTTSFIAFYKLRKNFFEHFISTVYVFSTWSIILTLVGDIISLVVDYKTRGTAFLFITLIFIWNARIYRLGSKFFAAVGKTLLQFLIFLGIVFIGALILYFFDPSTLKYSIE